MRRYLSRIENKIGFHFEGLSFKNIVVREVTPVDEFYIERSKSSDDGRECVRFTDPIRMLFNQERLNQIGSTAVMAWIDTFKNFKQDPLAEIRAKCSDEDLKCMIKSRHIQQPSELMVYAEWCQNNMETFNKEVQKLVEARDAKIKAQSQAQTQQNVESPETE